MTWLVFGVSVLLVAAGAVSILTGLPIVQIERGWTEVISGSVALSSGCVVFALAVVSLNLQRLRKQLVASPALLPAVALVPPEPVVANPPPEPDPAPLPPPVERPSVRPHVVELVSIDEQSSTEEVSEQRHGLWKRVRRPGDELPATEQAEPDARCRIEPAAFGFNARPPVESPPTVEPVEMPEVPAEAPAILPPDVPAPATLPAMQGRVEEPAFGWMDRALFRTKSTKPIERTVEPLIPALPAEPEPEPAKEPVGSVKPEAPNPFAFQFDASTPEPTATVPEPPQDIEPPPPSADIAEIGRYQAGSASYVMYSDGTIEVETEGGDLHRFGSMEELKAFIARQDSPVL